MTETMAVTSVDHPRRRPILGPDAVAGRHPLLTLAMRCAVLAAMAVSFFPIFWLFSTSFKPVEDWSAWPPVWVSSQPTLQNYRIVFFPEAARAFAEAREGSLDYKVSGSAWRAFADSAIIATAATLLSVAFGTLAAWSIARYRTGGTRLPLQLLTVRMFPPIAVVVPIVAVFSILRLSDTHAGMILAYTAFTLPFSVWMIRSFIEDVPPELEGAAMVHGLGRFRAFLQVTLPLIRGGLLATALFIFILNWSEFLFALVLTSGRVTTVTLQVANYVSASSGKLYGVQAAMGAVSTLPVVFLGYLIQRHLVRGLTFGAVKR
jgi:multiple sugar transport system permease protein